MSKENVKKFFAELEKNPELKSKYLDAMNAYQKESDKVLTGKVIEIGNKAGFSFTDADLHDASAELMDNASGNTELNDEDMAKASGGWRKYRLADGWCERNPKISCMTNRPI